ncbi:MAG: Gfo/Idh/MocA family oxidoreductase [Opitutaceae bacterium]|nr:Gfo/Idh/MocA family oxidoreductase [Opitutaceae bacterium]
MEARWGFASLDEALTQDWDAAVVATPAPSHVPIGRRLTARGIPLLVEKPIALGRKKRLV